LLAGCLIFIRFVVWHPPAPPTNETLVHDDEFDLTSVYFHSRDPDENAWMRNVLDAIRQVSTPERIKAVRLEAVPVSVDVIAALSRFRNLTKLNLFQTGMLNDETRLAVLELRGLEELTLNFTTWGSKEHFARLPALKSLGAPKDFEDEWAGLLIARSSSTLLKFLAPDTKLTSKGAAEIVAKSHHLQFLAITQCRLGQDLLKELHHRNGLTELRFRSCKFDDVESLSALTSLIQLRKLSIEVCSQFDDRACRSLAPLFPQLDYISFYDTSVTDDSVPLFLTCKPGAFVALGLSNFSMNAASRLVKERGLAVDMGD